MDLTSAPVKVCSPCRAKADLTAAVVEAAWKAAVAVAEEWMVAVEAAGAAVVAEWMAAVAAEAGANRSR